MRSVAQQPGRIEWDDEPGQITLLQSDLRTVPTRVEASASLSRSVPASDLRHCGRRLLPFCVDVDANEPDGDADPDVRAEVGVDLQGGRVVAWLHGTVRIDGERKSATLPPAVEADLLVRALAAEGARRP